MELFTSTNVATPIIIKFVGIFLEKFLCRLFIQMIKTKYINTFMKLNFISTVILVKNNFLSFVDFEYFANTIILCYHSIVFHSSLY